MTLVKSLDTVIRQKSLGSKAPIQYIVQPEGIGLRRGYGTSFLTQRFPKYKAENIYSINIIINKINLCTSFVSVIYYSC